MNNGINVLSLFDGMACGMLAMQKAGIDVKQYIAYEIDEYAAKTATHNFPMIKECGDVFNADFTQYQGVDYIVGGSPCTYWSIAQKNNRETVASGMGWELFKQYVRAVREAQPKYFVYENNKSMSNAIRESITNEFGFDPICINSALVSAQNRQRLYWVGKRNADGTYSKVDVKQPEDRGIILKDILESGADLTSHDKGFTLTASYNGAVPWNTIERSQRNMVAEPVNVTPDGKSQTLKAQYQRNSVSNFCAYTYTYGASGVAEPVVSIESCNLSEEYYHGNENSLVFGKIECNNTSDNKGQPAQGTRIYKTTGKSICLDGDSRKYIIDSYSPSFVDAKGKEIKVYEVKDGLITIKGKQYPIKLADGYYIIRKLTVTECKRLQTVPEWYEFPVSNNQAYKMLGNGWTVDVIAHILKFTKA